MFVYRAFLGNSLALRENQQMPVTVNGTQLTVRSLIKVDFPAPLGPITPTRLKLLILECRYRYIYNTAYLDSESAQLTLKRLGVLRPG